MTGAVLRITAVGVLGFVVMLLSATVALTALRGHNSRAATRSSEEGRHHHGLTVHDGGRLRRHHSRSGHTFMERLEERWRRRREQGF